MAKFQSPLLGYNNNVRHKNRVFHIQTEDSGVNHPHIITHLFMDGGRILKSVKKSYAEHVGADGMSEIVRGMMKEQHKAMFIALRDGQFDALVDPGATSGSSQTKAPAKPTAKEPAKEPAKAPSSAAAKAVPAPEPPAATVPPPTTRDDAPPAPPPISVVAGVPLERPRSAPPPPVAAAAAASAAPTSSARARLVLSDSDAPEPPVTTRNDPPPTSQELTLDFDAPERSSHDAHPTASSLFQAAELPPPPKNMFAKEPTTGGAYRAVEPEGSRRPPPVAANKAPSRPATTTAKPNENRYAPARPAAIFGSAPKPAVPAPARAEPSIFSDELISDKSLDEVILSYLAEDLEPPRRK